MAGSQQGWRVAKSIGVGGVQSVSGLNTDNIDPINPVVKISVDGTTITGAGTPASPLQAQYIPATNYGLYSQIANSVPVTASTTEGSLIGVGVGTLIVPANGFQVGDSFRSDFGGVMSANNNDKIRIRIKSGSVLLADSGLQTLPSITNNVWQLSINFTIRAIGGVNVASIVTLGVFHDVKTANAIQEGFAFNVINSTTFDTTIINQIDVTAQWSSNSALNSIYSDIFVLNKIY